MSQPITWRNVSGPSLAEASRPLQLAQLGFNTGLDALQQTLQAQQAANQTALNLNRETQTQNYLDAVAGAKTPEALAELQRTGFLDQMRSTLTPEARAAVRGADEKRAAALQQQVRTNNEFQDYTLDRAQAPVRDQVLALAYSDDFAGAKKLLAANPELRKSSDLFKAIAAGEKDMTKFGWERDEHGWKGEKHQSDLLKTASEIKTDAARRGLIGAQTAGVGLENQERRTTIAERNELKGAQKLLADAALAHSQSGGKNDTEAYQNAFKDLRAKGVSSSTLMKLAPEAALMFDSRTLNADIGRQAAATAAKRAEDEAQEKYFKENGIAAPGSTQPMRNIETLAKFAEGMAKDKKEQAALNRFIGKFSRTQIDVGNGVKVGIPEQVMKQAILESKDTSWFVGNERGDDAEKILKKLMLDPQVIDDIAARSQIDARVIRRQFDDKLFPKATEQKKK